MCAPPTHLLGVFGMGNYHDIEIEFVERTLRLIEQYLGVVNQFKFEEQYNYTLTLNCLLGLIVMPKERIVSYIPTDRLTSEFKKKIGLVESHIFGDIATLRDLITKLRHSVAHFDISVESEDERRLVDWVEFKDSENGDLTIAKFRANEIVPFLQYYGRCLIENMRKNKR
jgi:hypothetical protein